MSPLPHEPITPMSHVYSRSVSAILSCLALSLHGSTHKKTRRCARMGQAQRPATYPALDVLPPLSLLHFHTAIVCDNLFLWLYHPCQVFHMHTHTRVALACTSCTSTASSSRHPPVSPTLSPCPYLRPGHGVCSRPIPPQRPQRHPRHLQLRFCWLPFPTSFVFPRRVSSPYNHPPDVASFSRVLLPMGKQR